MGNWEWDVREYRTWSSDETIRLFDQDPETFEGGISEFLESVHPDDKVPLRDALRRALKGEPLVFEHRIVLPDGGHRTVKVCSLTIKDEDGRTVYMSGTVQDVTERRQAKIKSRESERRYRDVVENGSALIVRFLPDATLTFVNVAYAMQQRMPPRDLVGRNISEFKVGEDKAAFLAYLATFCLTSAPMGHIEEFS